MASAAFFTGTLCLWALVGVAAASESPVVFPRQFVVSTGTTIPFDDVDPIAQSGAIYFDMEEARLRIDNFWMGNHRAFIADLKRERGYLVSNGQCIVSRLTGPIQPFRVHEDSLRHADTELVRNVAVSRFSKTIPSTFDVQEISFYTREMNFSYTADDGAVKHTTYPIPWRLTSRHSSRKALAAAPPTRPNWRYFGEPLMDELVKYDDGTAGGFARRALHDVPVTVDFYNFVPMVPDATIFEPPALCKEPFTQTFAHEVDVIDVERHLMDLSFNTDRGRRLMDDLSSVSTRVPPTPAAIPPRSDGDL